ncbi:MAG: ABC transporter ATP-binding protein [Erysipelotrichaceae bacterium]|jgi:ABC-2 type transport system ATP-binding protein|nr:ABC transporter ATP-binding protein [Erysipelotrichaceae bacterium]
MIEVQEISKSFDSGEVLHQISFSVPKSRVLGVVGPVGSGKSTLLRILSGIHQPDAGLVLVDELPPKKRYVINRKLFFVSDEVVFEAGATLLQLRKFYKVFYSTFNDGIYHKLTAQFSLPEKAKLTSFSKGQRRLAALVLGLAIKPSILLLDEAFDGIDAALRHKLKAIITQQIDEEEMTVILSSHNLREMEDICDMICLLKDGSISLFGDIDEIKAGFVRIQLAFDKPVDLDSFDKYKPLSLTQTGKLLTLIIQGEAEPVLLDLQKRKPIFIQEVPLTLEEIFILKAEANHETVD